MASLWENFVFNEPEPIDVSGGGAEWYEGNGIVANVPWVTLFGSHSPFAESVDVKRAIYIVRHPVDCLYSCWKTWNSEVIDLVGFVLLRADEWKRHVDGFSEAGAYVVTYDDMVLRSTEIMQELQEAFGLTRKHNTLRALDHPVGWSPGEGATPGHEMGKSRYAKRMPEDAMAEIRRVVPNGFMGFAIE